MVAQRGYGLAGPLAGPVEATAARREKQASETGYAETRKMAFKEKRALETLPGRIEKLRADLAALDRKLADADFPARQPAAFKAATKAYAQLRDELSGAEDEWLGLEMLRESLEQQ